MVETRLTQNGDIRTDFLDLHDNRCSLQKSTAKQYDAIWLGISIPLINIMVDGGWKALALPEGAVVNSRMHLSQKMVKDMLPALEYFAKHGELPDDENMS